MYEADYIVKLSNLHLCTLMIEKFSNLNLKDDEIDLLGDFNINLFQNGKYILSGKRSTISQGSIHTMINRYKEFC